MLHKSHISGVQIYTPEWDNIRLGRFTSSKISELMGEKPYQKSFMTYVHQKAGELIGGRIEEHGEDQIDDENTLWGLQYEPEALQFFGREKKIEYLVTQKVIFEPGGCTSSTPDALWILSSSIVKEDHYNVATVEVKCPRKYARFFPLYSCVTPGDLKRYMAIYYWQVLDQMLVCSAPVGYFVCYHTKFPPEKRMKVIEFRKIDLWDDFSLLEQRKDLAIKKYKEIISQFQV